MCADLSMSCHNMGKLPIQQETFLPPIVLCTADTRKHYTRRRCRLLFFILVT